MGEAVRSIRNGLLPGMLTNELAGKFALAGE
jgi:hypothetical protein